jgi:DNA polymerase delta subunit 2
MQVDGTFFAPSNAKPHLTGSGDAGSSKTWVAMVSGLLMGAQEAPADLKAEMMVEWLTGEAGGLEVRTVSRPWFSELTFQDQLEGGRIARLILAGNTLTMPIKGEDDHKPVSLPRV